MHPNKFSVSKWLKAHVLLDPAEMRACLDTLLPCTLHNTSSLVPYAELTISTDAFLHAYTVYIDALQTGKTPTPTKPFFSAALTRDVETLEFTEVRQELWMARLKAPLVQLQHHTFLASQEDGGIHSMVMSPDAVSWGLQFAFPQMFLDAAGLYQKTAHFPNRALFSALQKWLRDHTLPTTFVFKNKKISTPIRLGKNCFAWIERHPQLLARGIAVLN